MASSFELPHNTVTVDKDDVIIVVTARGTETREAVADVGKKIEEYARDLRSRSVKVLVVIDARTEKLENSTKEGRAEFRRLAARLDVDAYAFVSDEHLITLMRYATRSFNKKIPLEFFTSMQRAKEWLLSFEGQSPLRRSGMTKAVVGVAVAIVVAFVALWLLFLR